MSRLARRCAAAAAGLALQRLMIEVPTRGHPVGWFGTAMAGVEQQVWRDNRRSGLAYTATGVAIGALAGATVRSTAAAVALTTAGHQLRRVASDIGRLASNGDLDAARAALPALVGRDPSHLDERGIAAAVIESVAENSVDAVVAPVLWAVAGGAAGAATYRAINTMDAMVGHRGERYGRFGTVAARLDDVANLVPARVFAVLLAASAPARAGSVWRTIRRDASAHPSPNAGVAEAAMAGLLGCELGGPLRYGERFEDRPRLGDGDRPTPEHIGTAVTHTRRAEDLLIAALAVGAIGLHWRRR